MSLDAGKQNEIASIVSDTIVKWNDSDSNERMSIGGDTIRIGAGKFRV